MTVTEEMLKLPELALPSPCPVVHLTREPSRSCGSHTAVDVVHSDEKKGEEREEMDFKKQGKIGGVSEMTWISVSRIVTVYIYIHVRMFL